MQHHWYDPLEMRNSPIYLFIIIYLLAALDSPILVIKCFKVTFKLLLLIDKLVSAQNSYIILKVTHIYFQCYSGLIQFLL